MPKLGSRSRGADEGQAGPDATSAAALAEQYGLAASAARPPLIQYIGQLWQRRHFILAFATARTIASYSSSRLGQLWQVLTPLLNAGIYFLLFGMLLKLERGIPNYGAFLVTGVFIFTFSQSSLQDGARSIVNNLSLVRALHFPRACLPLAFTIVELQQTLLAMVILLGFVLATHEPLTWAWLLLPVALLLQLMFNMGIGLVMARVGSHVQDISQLLPFLTRTWFYTSGVFFSIDRVSGDSKLLETVLSLNPAAVYIDLFRGILLHRHETLPYSWPAAVIWAFVTLVGGFLYFWQIEERYGRG